MINYIIQVILFQTLFLAVYDLFLSKETFFTKNRFYLMATAIVSFLLPLLRIPTLQKAVLQEYTILLPEILLSPQKVIEKSAWYENINYLQVLFWLGVAVFTIVFLVKLFTILKMIFSNEIHQKKNYKLVLLPKNSKAFSFFNYIFLGREIPQEKQAKIIEHELVHSQQKHSVDLLFFEVLKIVMWFNPMIYLYQKRITLIHEYISDEVATKSEEKSSYINNLLSEIFQVEHISFINQFYKQSLIKKRISMITKNKSKRIQQLKYLLLVPVLASMLFYVACSDNETNVQEDPIGEYKGRIEVNGKDYYLKVDDKGKTIFVDENGEIVDFEVIKPNGIERIYHKDGTIISEFEEGEDVPFSMISKAPTFPGCSDGDKDCLNKSLRKFVQKNFDADIAHTLGLTSGKKRIYIQFKIAKDGNITDIKVHAPHPKLKEEALRIASLLPRMEPGEHNGKKVNVGYTLPITFNIQ